MADNALTTAVTAAGGGAMSDEELVSYLQENADRAIGHYETEIAADQAEAIDFYYRRPMGDEREGRSRVVDGTVSTVIDNFVAAVLKPFVSSDDTVSFEPNGPEDEEQAEQATAYVNYVLHCDNPGFMLLHNWFKAAGLEKLGVLKVWWEDTTDTRPQLIEGMDASQIEQLGQDLVDGPFIDETGLFAAYVNKPYEDGRIKIAGIPSEEYLISPFSIPGETPPYEAHRTRKPRSWFLEQGFDREVVEGLSKYAGSIEDRRTWARYGDESVDNTRSDAPGDASRDMIEVYDEYILIDYDGDGVSELRRVLRVDSTVLLNEEVEFGPFATLCPVPMPHKVYGESLADKVKMDQKIKTVLQRQMLDNLYLANNPRPVIGELGQRSDGSTQDDLGDASPGASLRVRDITQFRFDAVPFFAEKTFPMLSYIDQQIEEKSGISKTGNGLDRDALNKGRQMTATQAAQVEDKENERAEMVARIFAETGVKQLFKTMLKLLIRHQPRERVIRLRNKWVPIDPREWNSDMDLSISVGLGVGNQQEQITQAQTVLALMQEVGQTPYAALIDETKVYNALKRAFTAAGIKNIDDFLNEPKPEIDPETGEEVPKQQPPSPEEMEAQAKIEEAQAKLQLEQQKAEADIQIQREKNAAQIEMEREKAALQAQLAQQKAAAEIALERERMANELALERERMQINAEVARESNAMNADVKREQAAEDAKLKKNRPGGSLSE